MTIHSRREFIHRTIKGAAGALFVPKLGSVRNFEPRPFNDVPVIVIEHEDATSPSGTIRGGIVQSMLDAGITALTGFDNRGEAWKSLFPGITLESVISIKVNCIQMGTHPRVADAVVKGLTSMKIGDIQFPPENIIIWDRLSSELRSAGFIVNNDDYGVKCYGTDGHYEP